MPNAQVAALLPPGLIALGRTLTADQAGLPDTLVNTDKNNFSPRVGFAWRLDESNKTVLRGGFGLFHPTVAVQGIRDLLATNEFRYGNTRRGGRLRNGFSGGTASVDLADFGNQGIDPNLQSPDIYQYNLTLERELAGQMGLRVSYIGSTMRKLLVDRDLNTLPASTVPFDPPIPADYARLPFPLYGYFMDIVSNAGSGQFHAVQLELIRRWQGRSGVQRRLHAGPLRQQCSGHRQQHDRSGPVRSLRHRKGSRSRSERRQAPRRRERDLGHSGGSRPAARREHGGLGRRALRRLDGLVDLPGAQRPEPDPVLQRLLHDEPVEHGEAARRAGQLLLLRVAAGPDRGSEQRREPRGVLRSDRVRASGAGQLGNAKKGSLKGPGTWVVNFAFYKDIVANDRFRLQFSALLDNAFNHPQFFPAYGSGFVDLTNFLVDGDANNGTTGVLGADTIANAEGFSPGRVIRLGIRATF